MTDKQLTIRARLSQIRADLIQLAHACNEDAQYKEAVKVQHALIVLEELDIACDDVAIWPPQVKFSEEGISSWVCMDD